MSELQRANDTRFRLHLFMVYHIRQPAMNLLAKHGRNQVTEEQVRDASRASEVSIGHVGGPLKSAEASVRAVPDLKGVPEPVRAAYQAPPTAWDAETAAEAGRKSAAARKRRAEMSPEERVRDSISKKSDALVKELLDAALGEGDFGAHWEPPPEGSDASPVYVPGLKPETRVTALTRLLEWQLGRPASVKPKEDPDGPAIPTDGEALFT